MPSGASFEANQAGETVLVCEHLDLVERREGA